MESIFRPVLSCLVGKGGSAYLRVEDLRLVLLEDSGKTFFKKKESSLEAKTLRGQ